MIDLDPIRQRLGPDFRPINIHFSDRRQLRIPDPDFIALGRVVIINETHVDHLTDALHIVSVDEAGGTSSS